MVYLWNHKQPYPTKLYSLTKGSHFSFRYHFFVDLAGMQYQEGKNMHVSKEYDRKCYCLL